MTRFLAMSLLGVALLMAGCAARTGPIRGESRVEGDSTSARGRGEVTTESRTEQSKEESTSGQARGSVSGSGSATVQ